MGIASRLYRGETEFKIIAKRKRFYVVATVLVLISLASMLFRGFNQGVEFKGGATFQWPANGHTVSQARQLFEDLKLNEPIVQTVGRGTTTDLRVQTPPLTDAQVPQVVQAITERFPPVTKNQVASSSVGPAWGQQVTNKALQGLIGFLIAVIIYLSIRFEPKMAVAAIIGLLHDLVLAAGIYSLTQFVVTPSTVIALLTILGFSLYDAVVIFDKVQENTRGIAGGSATTYTEASELALNQSFMRSVNTTLIALLPVSGLLFVGAFLLGAGTLKDLSLALFVGLFAGAYSSIFLCTPLFVELKEREPQYKALTQRVLARRSGGTRTDRAAAAARSGTAAPVVLDKGETAAVGTGSTPVAAAPTATRRPAGGSANRKKGRPGRPGGKKR
ncbi:MAG: protein translocase subunit secF [Frankiales bacterium]|nr:protein translocase subunit secF [Frankiales bacterium]